jgi:transcriptional regulator with XRE-family HTH domain
MNLGALIRKYRKEKKLTLKVVAQKSGVSEGFMSQVENNVKSPSVETLMNICEAIGVQAGDLLNQLGAQDPLTLIRKADWEEVDLPHTGFATRRFCSPEDRSVIDSAVLFLNPGKSLPVRKNIKNSQEIISVLQGRLDLTQADRSVVMVEGDAVHVWTDPDKQIITNTGDGVAVVLWVGTL